ncbi:MAG: DUF4465 domain-containing protein [Salibacteraceae bacterium]
MKHVISLSLCVLATQLIIAQTQYTETFDSFNVEPDTFLNGSDGTTVFNGTHLNFPVGYDTVFDYWASGVALSTMTDTADGTFTNLYSAFTSSPDNNTYGVANLGEGSVEIIGNMILETNYRWESVDVAPTTYLYKSMLYGDAFAKKFGGPSGDDPDYFFIRFYAGSDSLDFYLADFRFEDNTEDYIIDDWTTVDLTSLSSSSLNLSFKLFSSDTGAFGINTPLFFALDNLSHSQLNSVDVSHADERSIWSDGQRLRLQGFNNPKVEIFDLHGRLIYSINHAQNDVINHQAAHQLILVKCTGNHSVKTFKLWH